MSNSNRRQKQWHRLRLLLLPSKTLFREPGRNSPFPDSQRFRCAMIAAM
jgi:hypothetical protein